MVVKRLLLAPTKTAPFEWFLRGLEHLDQAPAHLLRVITYHRVDEPDANPYLYPSLLSATPEVFETQMRFLGTHYNPISIDQLLAFYDSGKPLPSRAILVTFDDATRDFEKYAWSILKSYQIPALLFVPTGFPDQQERLLWWDQLYNAVKRTKKPHFDTPVGRLSLQSDPVAIFKKLRDYAKSLPHVQMLDWVEQVCGELDAPPLEDNNILGWEQLRKLVQEGVALGAHTRIHPLLNRVSLEEALEEAVGSLHDLEEQFEGILPVLAYPGGGFTHDLAHKLGEAGFKVAFTTTRGINNLRTADPLRLRRINIGFNTSMGLFRAQLLSLAVHLNRLYRGYEGA